MTRFRFSIPPLLLGVFCAASLAFAQADVETAYQRFDSSVERFIATEDALADAEDRLDETKGEAQRTQLEAQVRRLRGELRRAEQRTLKTARSYLGDRVDDANSPRSISGLSAELRADARRLLALGKFNDALYSAEKAIRLNAEHFEGYLLKAGILLELGNYRTAVEAAHQALDRKPGDRDAYKVIGAAQLRMGNLKQAADSAALFLTGKSLFRADGSVAWALPVQAPGEGGTAGGSSPLLFVVGGLTLGIGGFLTASFLWSRRRKAARRAASTPAATASLANAAAHRKAAMGVDQGGEEFLAGKYEFADVLEYGSASQVWAASDHSLKRRVVVQKVLRETMSSPTKTCAAFVGSARRIAALSHPNIVGIFEVLDRPDGLFLVREALEGKTVGDIVREIGRLPARRAFDILSAVCAALEAAHAGGVYHGSLSPANIHVSTAGHVKLLDFGLSRILGEFAASGYLPPESGDGRVTPVVDVYSLGACARLMLTGGQPEESIDAQGLPPGVEELIAHAMEVDPSQRVASIADFSSRLKTLRSSLPSF